MAAVSTAIAAIGAGIGAASLANSIEQSNQQRRLAGQAANSAQADADRALKLQGQADADAQAQKMANQGRANQRARVPGTGQIAPTGQPGTQPIPTLMGQSTAAAPGAGTLLGQ